MLGDRRAVDRPVLHAPPQAGPADDQSEQAGVDGPLLDTAEERRHLGRARQRVVRRDVDAGATGEGGESRDQAVEGSLDLQGCGRDRVSRTSPIVRIDVTRNVTPAESRPEQGG